MSNDNNQLKDIQEIRLRRMFSRNNEQEANAPATDDFNEDNLNYIQIKFEQNLEKKSNFTYSVAELIKIADKSPTDALMDYIDDLQQQYAKEETNMKDDIPDMVEVDIEQLIRTSEAELLMEKDQRSVLYDLIDEIKGNSSSTTSYSDERFEYNVTSIINDSIHEEEVAEDAAKNELPTLEDVLSESLNKGEDEDLKVLEEEQEILDLHVDEKQKKRKYFFFLFVIIGLIVVFYLYKDALFNLFNELNN